MDLVDPYRDYARPMKIVLMEEDGASEDEIAYELEVMDARHHMDKRYPVRKTLLWIFQWVPLARQVRAYLKEYEDNYVWHIDHLAYNAYIRNEKEEAEVPRLELEDSFDGSLGQCLKESQYTGSIK